LNALTANIPEHAVVSVLVVDLDGLTCIEASASGFNKAGCKILSDRVGELRETVGLRVEGLDKMIRGRITSVQETNAKVSFEFEDEEPREKRKEQRREVRIPAQIADPRGGLVIPCVIVDASKSGCRLDARDLDLLPNSITLHITGLDLPVKGRIAWRGPGCAGIELLWQFSKSKDLKKARLGGGPDGGSGSESGRGKRKKRRVTGGAFGLSKAGKCTLEQSAAKGN
jgi:hypothetical protein